MKLTCVFHILFCAELESLCAFNFKLCCVPQDAIQEVVHQLYGLGCDVTDNANLVAQCFNKNNATIVCLDLCPLTILVKVLSVLWFPIQRLCKCLCHWLRWKIRQCGRIARQLCKPRFHICTELELGVVASNLAKHTAHCTVFCLDALFTLYIFKQLGDILMKSVPRFFIDGVSQRICWAIICNIEVVKALELFYRQGKSIIQRHLLCVCLDHWQDRADIYSPDVLDTLVSKWEIRNRHGHSVLDCIHVCNGFCHISWISLDGEIVTIGIAIYKRISFEHHIGFCHCFACCIKESAKCLDKVFIGVRKCLWQLTDFAFRHLALLLPITCVIGISPTTKQESFSWIFLQREHIKWQCHISTDFVFTELDCAWKSLLVMFVFLEEVINNIVQVYFQRACVCFAILYLLEQVAQCVVLITELITYDIGRCQCLHHQAQNLVGCLMFQVCYLWHSCCKIVGFCCRFVKFNPLFCNLQRVIWLQNMTCRWQHCSAYHQLIIGQLFIVGNLLTFGLACHWFTCLILTHNLYATQCKLVKIADGHNVVICHHLVNFCLVKSTCQQRIVCIIPLAKLCDNLSCACLLQFATPLDSWQLLYNACKLVVEQIACVLILLDIVHCEWVCFTPNLWHKVIVSLVVFNIIESHLLHLVGDFLDFGFILVLEFLWILVIGVLCLFKSVLGFKGGKFLNIPCFLFGSFKIGICLSCDGLIVVFPLCLCSLVLHKGQDVISQPFNKCIVFVCFKIVLCCAWKHLVCLLVGKFNHIKHFKEGICINFCVDDDSLIA